MTTSIKFTKASIMVINNVEYIALELPGLLHYEDKIAARRFVNEQSEKVYVAELKQYREKRSLDANAYYHVLLGKLSEVLRIPTTELYRAHIREIGGNFEIIPIREEALNRFTTIWQNNGLGWVVDDLGKSKLSGYANIKAYYGSSTYNINQMSRLIDMVVQDCIEQEIEVRTPIELERLKEEWGAIKNNERGMDTY